MVKDCDPIKIGNITLTWYNEHNPNDYVKKLSKLTDDQLYDESKNYVWFSAYAHNNRRSDFHWMCDACYEEAKKRGKPEIYTGAHARMSGSM